MNKMIRHRARLFLLFFLSMDMVFSPVVTLAKSPLHSYTRSSAMSRDIPAVNALPDLNTDIHENNEVDGVSAIDSQVDDQSAAMDIYQSQTNIVVNWNSFDVGENASVTFHQEDTSWSALNRIWDANPSAIFGSLSADGRIFLINQNGMIFGPDATVNVHTLVATTLNMDDEAFRSGEWKQDAIDLASEDYQNMGDTDWRELEREIINEGYITAGPSGGIFLAGPTVRNAGTLAATNGQVALAAGTEVSFSYETSDDGTANSAERRVTVAAAEAGLAENAEGATISADHGRAGMYGSVVNQDGLITAVTAVEKNGVIELLASERVVTGINSEIRSDISDGDELYNATYDAEAGKVIIAGLNSQDFSTGDDPETISLAGKIVAPGGTVQVRAENEVALEETAVIDVSGVWSDRSASDNELEVQLNSAELTDSFEVREGPLKGQTIYVDALQSTSLAHIDGQLNSETLTAQQTFTQGGDVILTVNEGRVRIEEGAKIDFSGGGYHYDTGDVRISYVKLGSEIFDVADVPEWALAQGDRLELVSDAEALRLGLATTRTIQAYDEGHDAGSLTIKADAVTLKGELDGSAVQGRYQTYYGATEPSETVGDVTYQLVRGRKVADAGVLTITPPDTSSGLDTVILTSGNSDSDDDQILYLSTDMLTQAGLGTINITGGSISTESDASLELAAGGSLSFNVRGSILHQGDIYVPGGTIDFQTSDLSDADESPPEGQYIYLTAGSTLSTAGINIDYSLLGSAAAAYYGNDLLDGGTITITGNAETTDRVIISEGSLLDVSGGYAVDPTATTVLGGDAGNLDITGRAVILEGEMRGHALVGYAGGSLSLHAYQVYIHNLSEDIPVSQWAENGQTQPDNFDELADSLHISAEQLAASGFSDIAISSVTSPVLAENLTLSPSLVHYTLPLYMRRIRPSQSLTPVYRTLEEVYASATSLSITANAELNSVSSQGTFTLSDPDAQIVLESGDTLSVTPGGTISLQAPFLEIDGTLDAPSGTISLTASVSQENVDPGRSGIVLGSAAVLNTRGYLRPILDTLNMGRFTNYEPEDGGSVVLETLYRDLTIENGAFIDVSGADGVVNTWLLPTGAKVYDVLAGEGGSVEMTAMSFTIDEAAADALFAASAGLSSLQGGELTLSQTDRNSALVLDLADLIGWTGDDVGFDTLTLQSLSPVDLQYSEDVGEEIVVLSLDSSLTIDAPGLTDSTGLSYWLEAPYVQLINDIEKYVDATGADTASAEYMAWSDLLQPAETAQITIAGTWLDIDGQFGVSGVTDLLFDFDRDIQLTDLPGYYDETDSAMITGNYDWRGGLYTLADLTISCDRLYATTQTTFVIQNGYLDGDEWIGGEKLRITGNGSEDRADGAIYSADSTIELRANIIETEDAHIMAPIGRILVEGLGEESSVTLSGDTILSVSGDADVLYGLYEDGTWQKRIKTEHDGDDNFEDVTDVPEQSVTIEADVIVAGEDTLIDVSGGGTIYGYEFVASTDGSADPLTSAGRYVILADRSVQRPGEGIYLTGVEGLADGWYSLLPYDEYAFVDGALIIEDLGAYDPTLQMNTTAQGYDVAVGRLGNMGTGIASDDRHYYAVRSVSGDVLSEGQYNGAYIEAGDGGTLAVQGLSTTLDGTVLAQGLDGYSGGRAVLSALNIYVGDDLAAAGLESDGLLRLGSTFFSDAGFSYMQLGTIIDELADSEELPDSIDQVEDPDLQARLTAVEAFKSALSGDFDLLAEETDSASFETLNIIIEEGTIVADSLGLYAVDQITIGEAARIETTELLAVSPGVVNLTVGKVSEDGQEASAGIRTERLGIMAGEYNLSGTPGVSGLLALGSPRSMALVRDGIDVGEGITHLSEQVWGSFEQTPRITLVGPAGITIYDGIDVTLQSTYDEDGEFDTASRLAIHTPLLALGITDEGQAGLTETDYESLWQADTIELYGSAVEATPITRETSTEDADESIVHTMIFQARDTLGLYGGDLDKNSQPEELLTFDGVDDLQLTAANDMIFGVGGLQTGNADLTLTAARITSTYERDSDGEYQVGDYIVDAGTGTVVTTVSTEGVAGDLQVPGGHLSISADTIHHGGIIDISSGVVTLIATGDTQAENGDYLSGLFIEEDSQILVRGGAQVYDIAGETVIDVNAGGTLVLESAGDFTLAETALIDVSNTAGTDLTDEQLADLDEETIQAWADEGRLDAGAVIIQADNADLVSREDEETQKTWEPFGGEIVGTAGVIGDIIGLGGSFGLSARTFDYDTLAARLGDFTYQVELLSREGNLSIGSALSAEQIRIEASGGAITVSSTLNASGSADDRFIGLYASSGLTLESGSLLDVHGTDGAYGGQVFLSSADDWVTTEAESIIDVSGDDEGEEGTVTVRAQQTDNDVQTHLYGHLQGTDQVTVHAVHTYPYSASVLATTITANTIETAMLADAQTFMSDNQTAIQTRLSEESGGLGVNLRPEIEIVVNGSLNLLTSSDTLDFTDWRFGEDSDVTGIFTVRATGDLTVQGNIVDTRQDLALRIFESQADDTWDFNFAAGADADSADPLAVVTGEGDFSLLAQKYIYTESGALNLAAGRDVLLDDGAEPYYGSTNNPLAVGELYFSIATYDGDISVTAGRDLVLDGGSVSNTTAPSAIQTSTGDIRVNAGRDVKMNSYDAIRTLGQMAEITFEELSQTSNYNARMWSTAYGDSWEEWQVLYADASQTAFRNRLNNLLNSAVNSFFWLYDNGGNVDITAGRNVKMSNYTTSKMGWMQLYQFDDEEGSDPSKYTAAYTSDTTAGTSPFSGIGTMAGGDVTINSGRDVSAAVATFGAGDLAVHAGNNMDGRYLVNNGNGVLTAMGSFGRDDEEGEYASLEMGRSNLDLTVQGDVFLGRIINPVFAELTLRRLAYIDYDEQSEAAITALTGDLTLSGKTAVEYFSSSVNASLSAIYLPPIVSLTAGRDLLIEDTFTLAPSSYGQLSMVAGRDILAEYDPQHYTFIMADEAPEMYYTCYLRPEGYDEWLAGLADSDIELPGKAGLSEFSQEYLEYFYGMWNSLDEEEKEPYQAIYDRIVSDLALHEADLDNLQAGDLEPVTIRAGRDIVNLRLEVPKAAEISAGNDIINLDLIARNNNAADEENGYAGDVTSITAGGDIILGWPDDLTTEPLYEMTGIQVSGPGWLMIGAGGSIDLGITQGILTLGQDGNSRLDDTGATVMVTAGHDLSVFQNDDGQWDPYGVLDFYTALRDAGLVYSAIKQGQRTDPYTEMYDAELGIYVPQTYDVDLAWIRSIAATYDWAAALDVESYLIGADDYDMVEEGQLEALAQAVVDLIMDNLIVPYLGEDYSSADEDNWSSSDDASISAIDFEDALTDGAISMVQSQVVTQQGGGIYMLVHDALDVGLSAFGNSEDKKNSGINTQLGGDIGIFAKGDINVNESRIMTWYGGDAIIWSSEGDINAGKGSKTAVSVASNDYYFDDELEQYFPQSSPPAVGSGIRLQTHDPDGIVGPNETANPGNGYLFAPLGDIDAGEAGIGGLGLLVFEAQRLINMQNVESGGISIGVSDNSNADAGIGGLTGDSSMTNPVNTAEQESMMKPDTERFKEMVTAMNDALVKWLAVEVTGFDPPESSDTGPDTEDEDPCAGLSGDALAQCRKQQAL